MFVFGEIGDELFQRFGDDVLKVADHPGDGGLVNEQQLCDQFFRDVGLEVHDGRLYGLAKRELPWSTHSAIPDDALFDARDDLIELCWGQSCSSLAWQWFLRGRRLFGDDPRIIPLEPLRYPLRHANSLTFSSHFT